MRARALLLFSCLSLLTSLAADRGRSFTVSQLRRSISEHISQERFSAAMWGIKIVSLDSGATLFETNAQKLFKPASNAKVFTGALALDVLGPDFRIRTSLLSHSPPDASGKLTGDLAIFGRGDPTFAARFQDDAYTNLLRRVIEAVRDAGIKRIEGDLIGDNTFFTGSPFGSSWTWDDLQYYYGAEVSALSYQDNVIDLFLKPAAVGAPCGISLKPETTYLELINRTRTTETNIRPSITITRAPGERRAYINGTLPRNHGLWVDAVTVPKPSLWFITALRDALEREGIRISGELRTRSWPEHSKTDLSSYQELAFTESAPLAEIVAKMLKPSQNLYAQLVLLQVGAQSKLRMSSTEDAGVAELRAFTKRAGINPDEVLLDEGSGLSRSALVTPDSLAKLHQYMSRHAHGEIYREALPGPGEGTLRTRFKDLAASNLRAKTGTIRYVNTLSGYIDTKAQERLAFAIMLNGYDNNTTTSSRDELDIIVRDLARLTQKSK